MGRSGYRRTARTSVAVLGAVVLAFASTACNDDANDTNDEYSDVEDGKANDEQDTPAPDEELTEEAEDSDAAEEEAPQDEEPADDAAEGAGDDESAEADGEQPDSAASLPYVLNFFGEENVDGNPEREPGVLVLSEFSSLQDVTWESWDTEEAVGVAALTGMWCLPECQEKPFEATVTLSAPETINGDEFYTRYEVNAPDADLSGVDDLNGEQQLAVP